MYTNKYSHLGITLSHKLHAGLVNELLRSANYDCNTVWSQWSSLNVFSRLLNILRFTVLFTKAAGLTVTGHSKALKGKMSPGCEWQPEARMPFRDSAWYHSWKSLRSWMGNTLWVISAVSDHLERYTWVITLLGPTLHTDFRNPFQSCFNSKPFSPESVNTVITFISAEPMLNEVNT